MQGETSYKRLRERFPDDLIQTLPATAKRPAQDYVGHAAVTDRLNEAAPGWSSEVLDRFVADGDCWVLLKMTIDGVSREEYGDGRDPKSAIGNALRRCAMRWGVALDLWSKAELMSDTGTEDSHATSTDTAPSVAAAAVVPVSDPTSEGGAGGSGTPSATAYGEGAEPDSPSDPLAALLAAYGSPGRALLAARKAWGEVPDLISLTPAQVKTLLEEAP